MKVPFNLPFHTGNEADYIKNAFENGQLSGNGPLTKQVSLILQDIFQAPKVLLTHSCTAALEMSAMLIDISPGDEVIMPSYTFVSTANAFVLRGARPVFVDIDPLTFNISPSAVENAITSRTKAIVAVHYAGISCDMNELCRLAHSYGVTLIEDAAQAIYSLFNNRPLGSFGDLATVSFHETKNISCGEGGCLVINNPALIERAEIIWEKGTDRTRFHMGLVDKYTWQDIGSSFLPGEISAALLLAQLDQGQSITSARMQNWKHYDDFFCTSDIRSCLQTMHVPSFATHNAHMYYLLFDHSAARGQFMDYMKSKSISCVFHYVPLHLSPAGKKYGSYCGDMKNTLRASDCLIRLPISPSLDTSYVTNAIHEYSGQL